ncbi:hypothetical protein RSAG8_09397, partial [Rhizoctonia solani AG-8 WAC10335]
MRGRYNTATRVNQWRKAPLGQ